MATNKTRLAQLEKQEKQAMNKPTWKELATIANDPIAYKRSIDSLAEALGVTRDELDEGLAALRSNEVKP